jgi:hypothetical protein
MTNNFLEDASGNKSSKRLWGSIILGIGILFSAILFFYSLKIGAKDAATALGIINMFLIAGSSLLGIGVFERSAKKQNQPEIEK